MQYYAIIGGKMNMLDIAIKVAENIEKGIKPLIGWEKSNEIVKIGADGTPTKRIDIIAENIAINSIEKYCNALLISEEIGFKKIGNGNPKYVIVLDPIDGTYNALNDIPIYSVSVAIGKLTQIVEKYGLYNNTIKNTGLDAIHKYIGEINYTYNTNDNVDYSYKNSNCKINSKNNAKNNTYHDGGNNVDSTNNIDWSSVLNNLTIGDLCAGVVKNIATGDTYFAEKGGGAYIVENGEKTKIVVSNTSNLKDASVGVFAYGLTTNTLDFIKDRKVRRIRIFGSAALEMCYVARGALDAFINVNKTTRLCDIAGGYVVLKEAGGIITDNNGKSLNMGLNVHEKTSIICSNKKLHKKFVGIFGNKWMLKPTKFGIISRVDRVDAVKLVFDIINYLDSKNIKYALESEVYSLINTINNKHADNTNNVNTNNVNTNSSANKNLKYELMNDLNDISHIISIGGDGTILRTSRIIDGNEIPIIPINMGTVGFLTEFDKTKVFDAIDKIINGNYEIEKRTKSSGLIKYDDGSQKILPDALNEVVIITKSPAKMLHFEVHVNGNFVEDVKADGLIISTPTGSTAYSLSAGGPILEPAVDAFVIVPICPFKLFSRPLVVDGNSEIKIRLLKKDTLVVVDGSVECEAKKGDEIILRKSNSYAYFVKGYNFYAKLRKLSVI
jgi:NAD+ kinase